MPLKTPAPASEADLQPGLWAEYFDDTGTYPAVSDVPAAARVERDLSLNVPSAPGAWPVSGSCAANFSGFIKIDTASLCTFFVYADDSARLYIDGELAVDSSGLHAMDETWGQADLTPGLHRLWVEYSNCGGAAGLNVCMKPKGGDKSPLSPAQLFHAPAETGAR